MKKLVLGLVVVIAVAVAAPVLAEEPEKPFVCATDPAEPDPTKDPEGFVNWLYRPQNGEREFFYAFGRLPKTTYEKQLACDWFRIKNAKH